MADARRAALKSELRREIDASSRLLVHTKSSVHKTGNTEARVVVPTLAQHLRETTTEQPGSARPDSPRRSESFMRNFHSAGAINAIRQVAPARTELPGSPRRGTGSPSRRAASPAAATASSNPVFPQTDADDGNVLKFERGGRIARSAFEHHRGIVIPAESSDSHEHGKLWLRKPLSDGSRHAQSKRLFPERRASSPAAELPPADGAFPDTTNASRRRTDSPGRRMIERQDNLSGCGAAVTREQPAVVTGRKHDSRTNSPSRAPYFEPQLELRTGSNGQPRRNSGLLGYGPTGKSHAVKPSDYPRLLDEESGAQGPERVTRGVRLVEGRSHRNLNTLALQEHSKAEVNDREERFRPSVVVMQGPPPFVPPPPPQRTQSPRRGSGKWPDSDIFNIGPAVPRETQQPLRVGRGIGSFSPARQERPF
jgi:hypothetical protein